MQKSKPDFVLSELGNDWDTKLWLLWDCLLTMAMFSRINDNDTDEL